MLREVVAAHLFICLLKVWAEQEQHQVLGYSGHGKVMT